MKPEAASPLSAKAARLLAFLVREISENRIEKGKPKTFVTYAGALRGMGMTKRGRAGQQLQREGLNDLNEWTLQNPGLPKIASLIVNKKSRRPSEGFASSHGRLGEGWEEWW